MSAVDEAQFDFTEEPPAVQEMIAWFMTHYELPEESCPYESAEGGFQYIYGGPYSAEDALWNDFPTADQSVIERAVARLEPNGPIYWARQPHGDMDRDVF